MKNPFAVAQRYLSVPQPRAQSSEADDPILAVDQWYPHFREFHHKIISETAEFDYLWVRENRPDLYRLIKAKEDQIDALGEARLSDVMTLMREWRTLVLNAYFEQRYAEKQRA